MVGANWSRWEGPDWEGESVGVVGPVYCGENNLGVIVIPVGGQLLIG